MSEASKTVTGTITCGENRKTRQWEATLRLDDGRVFIEPTEATITVGGGCDEVVGLFSEIIDCEQDREYVHVTVPAAGTQGD